MITSIAIVGCGPRGLSALEQLCAQWEDGTVAGDLRIDIFEPSIHPGAGQVYSLDQSIHNLLNVPERLIDLPGRAACNVNGISVESFPSYWQYSNINADTLNPDKPDHYPTRAHVGEYLHARFKSIADILISRSTLFWHSGSVTAIESEQSSWRVGFSGGLYVVVDEVVIAAGHQPTESDEQLDNWLAYAEKRKSTRCFSVPFPVEIVQRDVPIGALVALRGFGLATIDVIKALTEGLGGSHTKDDSRPTALQYIASGNEVSALVPFSLDGLPPGPRPLSATLDKAYAPSTGQLLQLEDTLKGQLDQSPTDDLLEQLTREVSRLSSDIYYNMEHKARRHSLTINELEALAYAFLSNEAPPKHDLIDCDLAVADAITGYVNMACGSAPISLDYCLGQVWRHVQPTLYKTLSYHLRQSSDQVQIIALDNRMKRYAYGPPVATMERVLSLYKAGILHLGMLSNPEIQTRDNSWILSTPNGCATANVMVNTVTDSTQINSVEAPLFESLLRHGLLKPTDPSLGVAITEASLCIRKADSPQAPPLYILGRLAQGSLIGVDALVECFGERQQNWAKALVAGRLEPR